MRPLLSIIIPVMDEDLIINDLIGHLYGLPFGNDSEIIVVDGNQSQNTLKAISRGDVKKIASFKGRGAQMNAGAAVAGGEILLFLHADTLLPRPALDQILLVLKQPDIAGGAFDLGINSNRWGFRLIETVASFRSRITRIPYGDQAIFIKKAVFKRLGGFGGFPLMEDVDLMRRVKKTGQKITIIPLKVLTSPRRWEKEGLFFSTLRNWILISLYLLGVSPQKLSKFYK